MSASISSLTPSLLNSKITSEVNVDSNQTKGPFNLTATPNQGDQQKPSRKQIEDVVKSLNEFVKPHQTSMQFKLYDKLNEYYIQVIDNTTKSVIQTIPSKQLLDAYSTMMQFVGMMFDKKA